MRPSRPFKSRLAVLKAVGVVCLSLVWGLSTPAFAAIFGDDEARAAILELRQRVDVMRLDYEQRANVQQEQLRRLSEENIQLRRSLIDLQTQIDNLRTDNARLIGRDEVSARALVDAQRQYKDALGALEERVRALEPERVSVDGREFLVERAEKRDFETGLGLFRKGDFSGAQNAFAEFIKRYPLSGYAPSAFFWLGNSQYATQNYKEAMENFRLLLNQSPDHARAPEAVLAIANCQVELKDTKGARKTLEDLIKAYPKSDAAVTAKQRLPRLKDTTPAVSSSQGGNKK
ncbi:tol-pal system protein YbgF [Hylemonella gracilis]|uniref:Cell division coordinator CpoB n=1 Tax=Hylemonella gracilis TaxID=80880 RepID=A0A4P6UJZ2_9BURK|nr:tol-pal system protein YbgF [Hylemonella gracilis]QBK05383.1 tol-pal system protein YbgF [Hylemonella gracilis]